MRFVSALTDHSTSAVESMDRKGIKLRHVSRSDVPVIGKTALVMKVNSNAESKCWCAKHVSVIRSISKLLHQPASSESPSLSQPNGCRGAASSFDILALFNIPMMSFSAPSFKNCSCALVLSYLQACDYFFLDKTPSGRFRKRLVEGDSGGNARQIENKP
jgi:hypothetical protein